MHLIIISVLRFDKEEKTNWTVAKDDCTNALQSQILVSKPRNDAKNVTIIASIIMAKSKDDFY